MRKRICALLVGLPKKEIEGAGRKGFPKNQPERAASGSHVGFHRAGQDLGGLEEGKRPVHPIPGDVAKRERVGGRARGFGRIRRYVVASSRLFLDLRG